jgi:hypothetical protein
MTMSNRDGLRMHVAKLEGQAKRTKRNYHKCKQNGDLRNEDED